MSGQPHRAEVKYIGGELPYRWVCTCGKSGAPMGFLGRADAAGMTHQRAANTAVRRRR